MTCFMCRLAPRAERAVSMVGGILTAGILLFAISGCERRASQTAVRPDTSLGPVPEQVSWDADYTIAVDGRPRANLRAGRMEQYRSDDSTYSVLRSTGGTDADTSRRVHIQVYDTAGDSSATIVANRVVQDNEDGVFDAYGNVIVTTPEGRRLESEHLTWTQSDRTIRTRRFVRITTPSEQVQGNGLVADEDLETYQIGRFTANVDVDADTAGAAPRRDPDEEGGGE